MSETAAIRYDIASAQAIGGRSRQEDTLAVSCPEGGDFGFAVVSDGMGGHAAGDLASRIIVAEVFAELILRSRAPFETARDLAEVLHDAVETANASLRAQIDACPEQTGMGGTVVATALVEGGLQWASVGDSLLYLLRDGRLERLNDDHSMAPQIDLMAARGLIDAEAARTHPQRNCLISALTGQVIPEVDCPARRIELAHGDIVLIASDGIQTLAEEVIVETLAAMAGEPSREIAAALLDAVAGRQVPEQDNTSLVVIKVHRPEADVRTLPVARGSLWNSLAGALRRPAIPAEAAAKTRN
ncbi:PP2C family protein-serine/threonine phosphatase [Roseicyclus sp.]|uniref:PP2C family protein-serine/threonine phosphatase n=1 Tax=Roseicyclus sp. TaxID=1914329 RepID=UPI003FA0F16D